MRSPVIVFATIVLSSSTLYADHVWQGAQTKRIVDVEVYSVMREGDLRAVTGWNKKDGWWLFVEKLEGGKPAWQHWVTDATWGRSSVSLGRDLRSLQLTGLARNVVTFNGHYEGRDWLKCRIDTRSQPWATSCEGKYTGTGTTPPPPPPPPPPKQNWAGNPNVIKACGDVFDGQANESACLDAMTAYRYDPVTTIAMCDRAMDGDDNELKCVRWGGSTPFDQSASLLSCDNAMDGDVNELKCFSSVINARYAMSAAIEACDRAMDGDENELSCIIAAVGAVKDPSATIDACEKAMDGDESELACIKRGIPVGR